MNGSSQYRTRSHKLAVVHTLLHSSTYMSVVIIFNSLMGCQEAQRAVDIGESKTRKFIQRVEPTGLIAETGARKETWEALRLKADQIDIETFNEAVDNLALVARKIASRLDAINDKDVRNMIDNLRMTLSKLRQQVDHVKLAEASEAITKTANTLEKQIGLFNVSELNSVLVEAKLAVRNIQATGTQVQEHMSITTKDVRTLANEMAIILQQLPTDAIEESMQRINSASAQIATLSQTLPSSLDKIDDTLIMVRLGSRIGIGVMVLIGCCAIVWLVKNMRPTQRIRPV